MARKKWVIWESIRRTPEERKWVEEQLNRERTPEELKRAILKLEGGARTDYGANWGVWFDKRIGAKLVSTGDEIYYKEADEEWEYAKNHFSELKRGFIDIIKQNPQEYEIKEYEVSPIMNNLPPGEEWKPRDMVVTNWHMSCIEDWCKKGGVTHTHYKNGFTKEEWVEIEDALIDNKTMTEKQGLLLKEIEELRENHFQGISERIKEWDRIYKEKKIEIERWEKLREGGKETIFPIERIKELDKEGKEELEKYEKAIKEKMSDDLSSWALDPPKVFFIE